MQNKTERPQITAIIAITALSSCIMLGAMGAYRLTSEGKKDYKERGANDATASEASDSEES